MADFFISHNRVDRSWAEWIAWQLETAGYEVILQEWDFRPGENFIARMEQALSEVTCTIVVLSPSYLSGSYSELEWISELVVDPTSRRQRLLIVRVRPCEPPRLLRGIIRIDLDGLDEPGAVEMLLAGVVRGRAKPDIAPTFPSEDSAEASESTPFPPAQQHDRVTAGMEAERSSVVRSSATRHASRGQKVVGLRVTTGIESFKDRHKDCRDVTRLLTDPHTRIVSIIGRRGIGKSGLACKVLFGLEQDDALPGQAGSVDGIIYLSTRTRTREISLERLFLDSASLLGGEAGAALLRKWTSTVASLEEKVEAFFEALADGLYIILLDNFEDLLTEEGRLADQDLQRLLDSVFLARSCPKFLITSQIPILLRPEQRRYDIRVRLDSGLPEDDGVQLLRELDVNGETGLRDAEDEDLRRAVRRVHGVPRALELIAAIMGNELLGLDELLQTFAEREDVLNELVQAGYRRLDEDARHVLHALAVFGRPVHREAIDWVLEPLAPGIDVEPIIARLARTHLVGLDRASRRVSLHPMDADFAYQELARREGGLRQTLEQRAAGWYTATGLASSAWHTVDDVASQLLAFEHWMRAGDYDNAARVLVETADFLLWHGSVGRVEAMHESLTGHINDPTLRLRHAVCLGHVLMFKGPLREAVGVFEQALKLAETMPEAAHKMEVLELLGDAYRYSGQLDKAVETLRYAIDLVRQLHDPHREAVALLRLGLTQVYRHDAAGALAVCEEIERLAEMSDSDQDRARAVDLRGLLAFRTGRFQLAIDMAEQGIDRYSNAGAVDVIGYIHNIKGMSCLALGRFDEALRAFDAGQATGAAIESSRLEGICHYNRAWARWLAGRADAAVDAASKALEALEQHGVSDAEAAKSLSNGLRAVLAGEQGTAIRGLLEAVHAGGRNADLYYVPDLDDKIRRLALEPSP